MTDTCLLCGESMEKCVPYHLRACPALPDGYDRGVVLLSGEGLSEQRADTGVKGDTCR